MARDTYLDVVGVVRLATDASLRESQSGKAWATFRAVVNRFTGYDPNNREPRTEPEFMDVVVFETKENSGLPRLAGALLKGQKIKLTGQLETATWEVKKNGVGTGEKMSRPQIRAKSIEVLGPAVNEPIVTGGEPVRVSPKVQEEPKLEAPGASKELLERLREAGFGDIGGL